MSALAEVVVVMEPTPLTRAVRSVRTAPACILPAPDRVRWALPEVPVSISPTPESRASSWPSTLATFQSPQPP